MAQGILLITSFLIGRYQRVILNGQISDWQVILNGQTSDWQTIQAGAPQDSNLGPLFFLIYIYIKKNFMALFMDGVQLPQG